jgi:hypothetical protein
MQWQQWQQLTRDDFAALDAHSTVVLLPVAAVEQHGPHLPVGTDALINEGLLAALAQRVEAEVLAADSRTVDPMTIACAEAGELLALRGPAGALEGSLTVPMDLEFVGLDSGAIATFAPGDVPAFDPAGDDARAERFRVLLGEAPSPAHRRELGEVLFAAHAAQSVAGRSERTTDFLVEQARKRREAGGALLGAKAAGRRGGTVVMLGERGKVWYEALRIKKALLTETGHSGHIFRWSSPGALSFGAIELKPVASA